MNSPECILFGWYACHSCLVVSIRVPREAITSPRPEFIFDVSRPLTTRVEIPGGVLHLTITRSEVRVGWEVSGSANDTTKYTQKILSSVDGSRTSDSREKKRERTGRLDSRDPSSSVRVLTTDEQTPPTPRIRHRCDPESS